MIKEINDEYNTVISIDLASGLDPDTGRRENPCVNPDHTLTLAMPKEGLNQGNSGDIWVLDISIPPEAYEEFGFEGDIFDQKSIVKLS